MPRSLPWATPMAQLNGYRAEQGSDLYIVDGDQDDWAYHEHGIFAFTIRDDAWGEPSATTRRAAELRADLQREPSRRPAPVRNGRLPISRRPVWRLSTADEVRGVVSIGVVAAALVLTTAPLASAASEFPAGYEGYHTYAEVDAEL